MLDTSVNSFHFYFLVAVLQGIVLSLIIIFRKPLTRPNIYFGILIFLFSLSLLHGVLEASIHAFNARFPFPMEYGFLLGPLTYFHFKVIADPGFKWKLRYMVYFIPSLVVDVIFFAVFFTYVRTRMEWANANVQNIQLIFLSIAMLFIAQMAIYIFLIFKMKSKTEIKPREFAPQISQWFTTFLIFWIIILLFYIVSIAGAIINIEIFDSHAYLIYNPMGILKAVFIYWIGYRYFLKHSNVIGRYLNRAENIKYSDEEATQREQQLRQALEHSQLYKDEKLTVDKLARYLGWSARDVSLIINEVFNTNFNDLMNTYRIKAFKELAGSAESKKYSIMGIAREVGFNSKASFYRAFKKECGYTPTEFLASKEFK